MESTATEVTPHMVVDSRYFDPDVALERRKARLRRKIDQLSHEVRERTEEIELTKRELDLVN